MTTITLVQAADYDASCIHVMTALPMNVNLAGLSGGSIQFSCTNPLANISGATDVRITYNAAFGGRHQTVQVGSVMS